MSRKSLSGQKDVTGSTPCERKSGIIGSATASMFHVSSPWSRWNRHINLHATSPVDRSPCCTMQDLRTEQTIPAPQDPSVLMRWIALESVRSPGGLGEALPPGFIVEWDSKSIAVVLPPSNSFLFVVDFVVSASGRCWYLGRYLPTYLPRLACRMTRRIWSVDEHS